MQKTKEMVKGTAESQSLRACVIGAGPAGLYASKFLAESGVTVKLFEKDERILGKYLYSRNGGKTDLFDVVSNPRVELNLNTYSSQVRDEDCDFYVCATGGIERELDVEGKELSIKAMDMIRGYSGPLDSRNSGVTHVGKNVCIIGMGNVTMDLVGYMQRGCNELTVLSRSSLSNAAFSNHKMREIVESGQWNIRVIGEFSHNRDRKTLRRYSMLLPFVNRYSIPLSAALRRVWMTLSAFFYGARLPTLNLVFDTSIEKIEGGASPVIHSDSGHGRCTSGNVKVRYRIGGGIKEQVFDSVISSIGFIPNVPDIETVKPVYYLGWCTTPRGSITDSKRDAELVVERILSIHSPVN